MGTHLDWSKKKRRTHVFTGDLSKYLFFRGGWHSVEKGGRGVFGEKREKHEKRKRAKEKKRFEEKVRKRSFEARRKALTKQNKIKGPR